METVHQQLNIRVASIVEFEEVALKSNSNSKIEFNFQAERQD